MRPPDYQNTQTHLSHGISISIICPEPKELLQEEAESKHMEGLAGYTTFKQEVLQATAGVIGCGTLSLSVLSGRDPALAFLAGGMAGLAYQRLLQLSVDAVPGGAKASALQQVAFVDGVCSCLCRGHQLESQDSPQAVVAVLAVHPQPMYRAEPEP